MAKKEEKKVQNEYALNVDVKALQALRGLAFAGIFLGHFYYFGWTPISVSVFFVLSGFLLTIKENRLYEEYSFKDSALEAFMRVLKLYPLHLVLTVICIPLAIVREDVFSCIDLIVKLICNIFLSQSLVPSADIAASLNGVAWYLSTILVLYILFPFIYRIFYRIKNADKLRIMLLLTIFLQTAIVFVTYRFIHNDDLIVYLTHCFPLYRVFDMLAGIILALLLTVKEERNVDFSKGLYNVFEVALILACADLVFIWTMGDTNIFYTHAPVTTLVAVLLTFVFSKKKGILTKLLTNKFIVFLGDRSGSAFLIHFPIVVYINTFIFPHLTRLRRTIIHGVCFPVAVVSTLVLSYLYDTKIKPRFSRK
jgi:peptidoglycan/LPS O-acetylase OafA/YrhL